MRLASQQGGVVTRIQAQNNGLSVKAIDSRLRSGAWQYVFTPAIPGTRRSAYATFTGPIGVHARLWAAVLVSGRGATLSHETAAALHGLLDQEGLRRPLHVTVPADRRVKPPEGVVIHYSRSVDRTRHPARLPPQTRLEETVIDLTQTAASLDQASGLIAQAVQRGLTTHDRILAVVDERKKLRWRDELRESCGAAGSGAHSLLELRYMRLVEQAHGLPRAERQVRRKADGRAYIVDNRYARYRVRVELDGQRGHTGDGVFRDMWRDNAAALDGDQQLRFGWDDVDLRCCESAAIVGALLNVPPKPCGPNCPAPDRFHELRRRAA